jgi:hypothetical protein
VRIMDVKWVELCSPERHAAIPAPVPVNMTLFANGTFADMSKIIWTQTVLGWPSVQSLVSLWREGNMNTPAHREKATWRQRSQCAAVKLRSAPEAGESGGLHQVSERALSSSTLNLWLPVPGLWENKLPLLSATQGYGYRVCWNAHLSKQQISLILFPLSFCWCF